MSKLYAAQRVLIVDEDQFTRDLIKGVLEEMGFQKQNVLTLGDGKEALELLQTKAVSCVICDTRMGSIDGLAFVRTLRQPGESPAPNVPVIFCSAQLDKKLVEEIREAGVNEAIIKPVTIGAIESRIRAIHKNPRPLVTLMDYVGPDRRRIDKYDTSEDRRSQKQEHILNAK